MPLYSTFVYGSGPKYGEFLTTLTKAYLQAQTIDYGVVKLNVTIPAYTGSSYAIVRTVSGAAEDPSSGLVINSGIVSAPHFVVADGVTNLPITPVPSGVVYYTLFIFSTDGSWRKDAATSVVVPKYRGTQDFLINALPSFYTSPENNIIDPASNDTPLGTFLYGFSVTYDELAQHVDMILPENRTRNVIRRLHGAMTKGVGMPDEYTIGTAANARLYRHAGYIYRNKGTSAGLVTYLEALTGWPIVVKPSTNMFLSLDDGSFEYSIGNWGITGGTLAKTVDIGPTFSYEGATSQFSRLGMGLVTMTSSTATLTLPSSVDLTKMIPVTAGTTYYFNIPMKASSGTPAVHSVVKWYDQFGNYLSSNTSAATTSTTSWQTISASAAAPTNSAYVAPQIIVSGATGNTLLLDMLNFTSNNSFYRDPRAVTVIVEPTRVNLIFNPSFQNNTTSWAATTGSLTSSTDNPMIGTKSGKAVGSSAFSFHSNSFAVLSGYTYELSAYALSNGGTASASIVWYDNSSSIIDTKTLAFGGLNNSSWTRVDVSGLAPANATSAMVSFSGTGTVYFDAVICERAGYPQIFFSGSVADSNGEDALWSGTAENSYSLLYPHRYVKLARMRQTIPYYLPVGVASRILFWNSTDPEVTALVPNG